MIQFIKLQFFIFILFSITSNASEIPKEVTDLIYAKQPHIFGQIISSEYDTSYIQKNFKDIKSEDSSITLKRGKSKTTWWLGSDKKIDQIDFEFDLSDKSKSSTEKKVLELYKSKITPEEFLKVSSKTRTLIIDESKKGFKLEVFFPVSDYEDPKVRSVTIFKKKK